MMLKSINFQQTNFPGNGTFSFGMPSFNPLEGDFRFVNGKESTFKTAV